MSQYNILLNWRRSRVGLMISTLDTGLSGPGSMPGRINALYSLARHFALSAILVLTVMGNGEFYDGK